MFIKDKAFVVYIHIYYFLYLFFNKYNILSLICFI